MAGKKTKNPPKLKTNPGLFATGYPDDKNANERLRQRFASILEDWTADRYDDVLKDLTAYSK